MMGDVRSRMKVLARSARAAGRRWHRDDSGASAVEFAMISALFLVILLNILDIGIYLMRKMEITSAVRAGAQYALVHDSPTTANIQTVVENATNLTTLTVTADDTQCGCSDGTTFACSSGTSCSTGNTHYYTTIDATYSHTWLFYPGATTISNSITIRTD